MPIQKSKEISFAFKDASGALRVVHVQMQHFQEGDKDHVTVIATSDGVPLETTARVGHAMPKVKTRSRL